MQVSYHGGSPLYFWPNYSLASRANPDVELRSACYWTKVPSVSLSFFPTSFLLHLSLSPSNILCVSSRSSCYLLSMAARRSIFPLFFLEPLDVLPLSLSLSFSLSCISIVASLSPSRSLISCVLFLYPVPSRPVVGKSGAADLLWNLYSYRAPQQWSQPPHFSTPDLCYHSGFLSSYHGNLFCEVIRPCALSRTLLCIERLYVLELSRVSYVSCRL